MAFPSRCVFGSLYLIASFFFIAHDHPVRDLFLVACAMAGLAEAGRMRSKQTVLVTAAAGGTGQFAVQLAKLAGNTVVATCGSDEKAQLLTGLGCDRVINYNKEQAKVLLECTSMHLIYTRLALPCCLHLW